MTTAASPRTPEHVEAARRLRQPTGLALLFFAEMWERFSYYGMRALLILYLVDQAGIFRWSQERASHLYGWYTGLIWFTPIIGGYLADRVLGLHRALVIGGIVIALGHFALAFETQPLFFLGLCLIVLGTGFFKANVSTMVGQLYGEDDPRRDAGFSFFYMGINLGGFLGPIFCGALAASPRFGWRYGFGLAGIGMVIGLITYLVFRRKYLGDVGLVPAGQTRVGDSIAAKQPLTREERDRVLAIVIIVIFTTFFWLASEQAGSSLNLFALERTDRGMGGLLGRILPNGEIPTAWFQSMTPFWVIVLSPLFGTLWSRLGARQPSTPTKIAAGLVFLGVGFVFMVVGAHLSDGGARVSALWLTACYFFITCGEVCLYPVGLSFVTKVAPIKYSSALMGIFFLSLFAASLLGGYVAGTVQAVERGEVVHILGGRADFFLLFVVSSFAAAGMLFLLVPTIRRLMHGRG
jgi:POT family proton-dependent oligopeptide transporter